MIEQKRRERRVAARERARERRRVYEPDEGGTKEIGSNVTVGPQVDIGAADTSHDQQEKQIQGAPSGIGEMRLRTVARSERGLLPAFYVWDT